MKSKSIQFSPVLIFVLASLLISTPTFAQTKTSTKKVGVEQIKKKETAKTSIDKTSTNKNLSRQLNTLSVVGDFAHGGIVIWVDGTGSHGLVCAKSDQSASVKWGVYGPTKAKDDGPYAGEANTAKIIEFQNQNGANGSSYAARICIDLQITEDGETFDDWYLPSLGELDLIFQNMSLINITAAKNGGAIIYIEDPYYWSSNEEDDRNAWLYNFLNGETQNLKYEKNIANKFRVRAVRRF